MYAFRWLKLKKKISLILDDQNFTIYIYWLNLFIKFENMNFSKYLCVSRVMHNACNLKRESFILYFSFRSSVYSWLMAEKGYNEKWKKVSQSLTARKQREGREKIGTRIPAAHHAPVTGPWPGPSSMSTLSYCTHLMD